MSIRVICHSCGKKMSFAETAAGRMTKCKGCNARVTVRTSIASDPDYDEPIATARKCKTVPSGQESPSRKNKATDDASTSFKNSWSSIVSATKLHVIFWRLVAWAILLASLGAVLLGFTGLLALSMEPVASGSLTTRRCTMIIVAGVLGTVVAIVLLPTDMKSKFLSQPKLNLNPNSAAAIVCAGFLPYILALIFISDLVTGGHEIAFYKEAARLRSSYRSLATDNLPISNSGAFSHGRVLVFSDITGGDASDINYETHFPDHLRLRTAEECREVGTLISLNHTYETVSTYQPHGWPARIATCHIKVIDLDSASIVGKHSIRGGAPPSKVYSSEGGYGPPPTAEVAAFIATLPHRPLQLGAPALNHTSTVRPWVRPVIGIVGLLSYILIARRLFRALTSK